MQFLLSSQQAKLSVFCFLFFLFFVVFFNFLQDDRGDEKVLIMK